MASVRSLARTVGAPVHSMITDLAAFTFPQRCPACGVVADAAQLLCAACFASIPRVPLEICARCLVRGREPVGCRSHAGFSTHAAWLFDESARAFVHALKYEGRPRLAVAVAGILAGALPARRFDLIGAVPLHALRRRVRGYNQAAALADALSEALGVPRAPDLLERRQSARPQALLGASRRRNLAGAFRAAHAGRIRGRSVLIVDDVLTTGATMDACLAALAEAGARGNGLVLAWAQ